MLNPDELSMMTEQEKLDLLRQIGEAEECQDCFEPIYRRLMEDESAHVRQEAVAALWDLADPRHVEPLMRMAESDPDDEVRAKAASVLGIYIYEAVADGGLDEAALPGRAQFPPRPGAEPAGESPRAPHGSRGAQLRRR